MRAYITISVSLSSFLEDIKNPTSTAPLGQGLISAVGYVELWGWGNLLLCALKASQLCQVSVSSPRRRQSLTCGIRQEQPILLSRVLLGIDMVMQCGNWSSRWLVRHGLRSLRRPRGHGNRSVGAFRSLVVLVFLDGSSTCQQGFRDRVIIPNLILILGIRVTIDVSTSTKDGDVRAPIAEECRASLYFFGNDVRENSKPRCRPASEYPDGGM